MDKKRVAQTYADLCFDETIEPFLHKAITDAVIHGIEKHSDWVYKTEFVKSQSFDDYMSADTPPSEVLKQLKEYY